MLSTTTISSGLDALLDDYLATHSVCRPHAQQMRRTARLLHAAGINDCRHLGAASVSAFLDSICGSTSTVAGYRRIVLALWRHAVRRNLCVGPVEAKPVRVRIPPVRAWTSDQLSTLVKRVSGETRTLRSGCPASVFFRAFVLLGYETGLRLSDLHGLRRTDFSDDFRTLSMVASKTGESIDRALSDDCAAAVRALAKLSRNDTIFLWALSRRFVKKLFTDLCRSCGLPGSVRWLRRSGATACEAASPGSASRYLAHRSPGVAGRHYVDWSQVRRQPTPPRLNLS